MRSILAKRFSTKRSPLAGIKTRKGNNDKQSLFRRGKRWVRRQLPVCWRLAMGMAIGSIIGSLIWYYGLHAIVVDAADNNSSNTVSWRWPLKTLTLQGAVLGGVVAITLSYWQYRTKRKIIHTYTNIAEGVVLESCTLTDAASSQPAYSRNVQEQFTNVLGLLHKERLITAANESRLDGVREVARQADLAKTRFLAQMSHEIRTPINGVLGMVDLLLNSGLTDQQDRLARIVKNSGLTLLQIINDLLDFAKIEEGKLELEAKPYNIRQLAEEIVEMLGQNAYSKGIEIGYYISPDIPKTLIGDPFRFRQIFTNLLGNAIKFTAEGEVSLAITIADHQPSHATDVAYSPPPAEPPSELILHFAVKDTGIGIPEDDRQRIFQAFSQGKEADAQRVGGTGLGLSIASQLVNMMGGSLRVESQVNSGSTFSFTVAQRLRGDAGSDKPFRAAPEVLTHTADLYILVADSSPISRHCFNSYASTLGVHCVFTERAHEVFGELRQAAARGKPFDQLFTTPQLPDMDSNEFLQRLQEDPTMADTQLALMAPPNQFADVEQQINTRLVPMLAKPLKFEELQACLVQSATAAATYSGSYLVANEPEPAITDNNDCHSIPEDFGESSCKRTEGPCILVAEDNPVNAEVTKGMLKSLGFSVKIVTDGAKAVQAVRDEQFAMVLMDGQMPNMDGLEATIVIRTFEEDFGLPPIPIIAVTANTVKGVREEHLAGGMDAFLTKPFTQEQLAAIMQPWLGEYLTEEFSTLPPSPASTTTQSSSPKNSDTNTNSGTNSAPENDLPTLERSALDSIRALQGDDEQDEFLYDIVNLYLQDTEDAMLKMTNALKEQNYLQLGRIAHKVKSGSANIGAARLAALSYAVEQEPERTDITRQISSLQQEFSRVRTALLSEIAA